jgi:predicted acylesterase/phospholipase RssA
LSSRRSARATLATLAVTAVATIGACAHYPATAPLPAQKPPSRYAFEQIPAADVDDDLFVCLTFSGGGTRAAAFSYGVLLKLRDTPIVRPKDGRHESLLDEVDCISSVSGGSFTAAYYALFGARIFQDYRAAVLDRDIQGDLECKALNPFNWPRLLSPYFSRIDLATELYGDTIFKGKTYGDLLAAGHRPFIILNATDLVTGDGFEFTQDQFDLIGSDLGAFPVARAVAASSAFPFLLTPVSLTNLGQPPWYLPPLGLAHAARDYYVNRSRFTWARNQSTYLDKTATPYVHVMDGGLADNIGLRALLRQLQDPTGFVGRRYNLGKASRMIFIVVNSKSGGPDDYNRHESPPGLFDVAFKTATTGMDNFAFEVIELMRDRQRALEQAQQDLATCKQLARVESECPTFVAKPEIDVVDVNLEAIADPERRARLLSIGTNFSLAAADVDSLIAAAAELLDKNPKFQALLGKLRPLTAPGATSPR